MNVQTLNAGFSLIPKSTGAPIHIGGTHPRTVRVPGTRRAGLIVHTDNDQLIYVSPSGSTGARVGNQLILINYTLPDKGTLTLGNGESYTIQKH